ncbi:MAG TPA: bifunctional hydroxymethylpyrimidine kinase/phosphomethylpyrimidine kinase [Polyangiaceae bacterium]|nr:bifunctional hydroxymethylpyrimidine kinase/phosphomethylpyrimidine kinase [Polyangiaceae bacterium]
MTPRTAPTPYSPCALAISGLDPSGGAGIFADLRAFHAALAWGCGAVAVVTVQSTAGLRRAEPLPASEVMAQVREICRYQNVRSIKIGALGSRETVRSIARWLREREVSSEVPVVLDPVLVPSRNVGGTQRGRLLAASATGDMRSLAALATLVTPNVPEAETLLDVRIASLDDAAHGALELVRRGARAALVKGGHLPDHAARGSATDVLAIGSRVFRLRARRIDAEVHGTGCALSSLIAGRLAHAPGPRAPSDETLLDAVRWAKQKLAKGLSRRIRVGEGLFVLPL